jgi:uncharacterized protein (TIGR03067 family)
LAISKGAVCGFVRDSQDQSERESMWRSFCGFQISIMAMMLLAITGCGEEAPRVIDPTPPKSPPSVAAPIADGPTDPPPAVASDAGSAGTADPAAAPVPEPAGTETEPAPPVTAAPADPPAAAARDGQWKASSALLAGAPFPPEVTSTISLRIAGDQYEVLVGNNPDKGRCTVDESQTPHQMTIIGNEGPNAGKTILAICELPGPDEFRVCYDLSGSGFPGSFESTAENKYFLVTYIRDK